MALKGKTGADLEECGWHEFEAVAQRFLVIRLVGSRLLGSRLGWFLVSFFCSMGVKLYWLRLDRFSVLGY